jgi:hypothetical protein
MKKKKTKRQFKKAQASRIRPHMLGKKEEKKA